MDLNKELQHLKKLMEEGKIKLLEEMAPSLRKVKVDIEGNIIEESVDGSVRALLLAIKAAESDIIDMNEIDQDFLGRMMSMDEEDRGKYFLSMPRERAVSYKEIFMRVEELEDLYFIISDLPEKVFKSKFNKLMIKLGGNPASILKDYIILEITKFHELMEKEKGIKLPPLPEYHKKIIVIRSNRIAHPINKRFKSNKDVEKLYGGLTKSVSIRS